MADGRGMIVKLFFFTLLGPSLTYHNDNPLGLPTFDAWRVQYNKTYTTEREEQLRGKVYQDNMKFVVEYSKEGTVTLGMGEFADLTHEEFREKTSEFGGREKSEFGGRQTIVKGQRNGIVDADEELVEGMTCDTWYGGSAAVPVHVDWRSEGGVTGVVAQTSSCPGNSYAIAALGAVTGQWYLESGRRRRVAFSEQQVVDCSRKSGNLGCDFGSVARTYSYIKVNGGIATRVNYRTTGKVDTCKRNVLLGPTVTGCQTISWGDEQTMKKLVGRVGPVTAVIDISPRSFQLYKEGVYYERSCTSWYADHNVLVVGYGTQYDEGLGKVVDYWLVKNSWGTRWGDRGYIKIIRNNSNNCGIATRVTVPNVTK